MLIINFIAAFNIMKRKIIYLLSVIFILIVFTCSLHAENQDIMPMDKIRPGMKGHGLTVFDGIKVEKFDVEIISVLKNIRPRSGLILARIKSDTIDKAGVIAGMSGSPVYIDNKLIGALAFSWAFSKEAITGITPIEDMMKVFEHKSTNHSFNFEPDSKIYVNAEKDKSLELIKTPLYFQGVSQNVIDMFSDNLAKMNFIPMSGAGDSSDYEVPEKFKPGSAVGVSFITGDLNIGGIGTVTYVDKEKMLIFGHPMFYSGYSDVPLSHAYIHTVLPSLYVSFKLGSITKIAGRVYQDQMAGLACNLNERAKMIPVKVDLDFFDRKDSFNYNIIRSYFHLPVFLSISVFRSLEMMGAWLEKNTLNFAFNIKFNNNKTIKLQNTFSSLSTRDTMLDSMTYLLNPITYLLINKFEKVQIESIDVRIELDNKIKIAEIENVIAPKKIFKPGEILKLKVKLRPYQGKTFYKTISIKLPVNLPEKKFMLFISSDQERQFLDFILSPGKYQPESLDHLIEIYDSLAHSTDLAVWAFLKDKSIIARGHVMDNLPSSYYSILQNSLETGMQKSIMQIKSRIPVDYIVVGSAMLTIEIKKDIKQ